MFEAVKSFTSPVEKSSHVALKTKPFINLSAYRFEVDIVIVRCDQRDIGIRPLYYDMGAKLGFDERTEQSECASVKLELQKSENALIQIESDRPICKKQFVAVLPRADCD